MHKTKILGTGRYLPENIVTNDDLAKRFDTSDEWIQKRSGIRERRYVSKGQTPADIGAEASRIAMDTAGVKPEELDFIILATQTPEVFFPGTACFVQERIGAPGIGALDIRDQCTGFLYGLSIADSYIRLGKYRRILLVSTEVHSTGLDYSNEGRAVTVLFGDGAAAFVLGPAEDGDTSDILTTELYADGRYAKDLWVEAPSSAVEPRLSVEMLERRAHYPIMNGQNVFRQAVMGMLGATQDALEHTGKTLADVDYFIPHQANRRINEMVVSQLKFDPNKVDHSIEKYGNCAAASVPIAFDECVRDGRISRGDTVMFATFAAGFTWGSALLTY